MNKNTTIQDEISKALSALQEINQGIADLKERDSLQTKKIVDQDNAPCSSTNNETLQGAMTNVNSTFEGEVNSFSLLVPSMTSRSNYLLKRKHKVETLPPKISGTTIGMTMTFLPDVGIP